MRVSLVAVIYCWLFAAPALAVCPCEVLDDAGRLLEKEAIAIPSIQLLDGRSVDLASATTRFVAVLFWATWCPRCQAELKQSEPLDQAFRRFDVDWVAVSIDHDIDALRNFASSHAPTLSLAAISFEVASAFKRIRAVPFLVIVDRQSGTVAALAHPLTPADVEEILGTLVTAH